MSTVKFPTDFAIDFAEQVGLTDTRTYKNAIGTAQMINRAGFSKEDQDIIEGNATELYQRLASFQKIASVLPYEKAVIVYNGFLDLTEEQAEMLKVIAELTPSWVKGEITELLLDMIHRDPKSAASIATAITQTMNGGNYSKEGGKDSAGAAVKSFYLELTGE